jgi:ABC-type Zn2+ transport system substrate-binding protein/surface adhesin
MMHKVSMTLLHTGRKNLHQSRCKRFNLHQKEKENHNHDHSDDDGHDHSSGNESTFKNVFTCIISLVAIACWELR